MRVWNMEGKVGSKKKLSRHVQGGMLMVDSGRFELVLKYDMYVGV